MARKLGTGGLCCLLWLAASAAYAQSVKVEIRGLKGETLANARAAAGIWQQADRDDLEPADIRALHSEAPREISRSLEPFGYYRPRIDASLQEPQTDGGSWTARYRIERGEAVTVGEMQVQFTGAGASDPDLARVADALPLQQGEILDHRRYETSKRDLLRETRQLGYRDAALVTHRAEVDLAVYTARVSLELATGPRFVIGEIGFDQEQFAPEYLSRYLLLAPGEPYAGSKLGAQRNALSRSGHFREVEIEPLPATDTDPPAIPLQIHLQPYLANRYRGRLGWGTDTGIGAQLDWNRRYVGGRGQSFNAGVALVEERRKLAGDLNYVIPIDPLSGNRITVGARHESKDLTFEDVELDEGGETRIVTNLLGLTWQRPFRAWGGFEVEPRLSLDYVTETYDVFEVLFGNLPRSGQQVIIDFIGREAYDTLAPDFTAVVPGFSLDLRRSDSRLFIRNGDNLRLDLLGASEALGSNIDFWQAHLQTWHIRSLGERNRFLLRTSLGYSEAESSEVLDVNFNAMPEYYEFRAGGVRSIRGYDFESLFPSDAITGGKHELVVSLEYEYEVIPKWSVALFVDGGNAFNRWDDYDPRYGTGIGVRWRSPVGLARLDIGVPLDDADDAFQIYITVGPEF